jgi:hypothetical protein
MTPLMQSIVDHFADTENKPKLMAMITQYHITNSDEQPELYDNLATYLDAHTSSEEFIAAKAYLETAVEQAQE